MRVLFRTEGNDRQGMGDVWGSLALAREFDKFGDGVEFLVLKEGPATGVIRAQGFRTVPSGRGGATAALKRFRPDVIVVNKRISSVKEIALFRRHASLVATVDDDGPASAHAQVNVNVLYPIPGSVSAWAYVPLREEFQDWHQRKKRYSRRVERLLVTQGGSDTHMFMPRILAALDDLRDEDWRVTVVVGPAFRSEPDIRRVLGRCHFRHEVVHNPADLARRFWESDLAVTAGGVTLFELMCLGTPPLVLCGEPFEVATADRAASAGAALNLGFGGAGAIDRLVPALDRLRTDAAGRQSLGQRGHALVDGRGAERVARLLREKVFEGRKVT